MDPFAVSIQKLVLESPSLLSDPRSLEKVPLKTLKTEPSISSLMPYLSQELYAFKKGQTQTSHSLKVGVVFSGGQASGGHNVICGLLDALIQYHRDSELIGFLGGPSGILENKTVCLNKANVDPYKNTGGFDLIGSGRTKIETPEQFDQALHTLQAQKLDALVIIGGDDSNTNGALLANLLIQKKMACQVIGVPKTIDGDLKNEYIEVSFGFDTASKLYAELMGNLERDCLSAKKYTHFVRIMGRSASHLVLEATLLARPNLALISEEIKRTKQTLKSLVSDIADLVEMRSKKGKTYGVIVIPEGLIESIDEMGLLIEELNELLAKMDSEKVVGQLSASRLDLFHSLPQMIQDQLLMDRDPHGNVNVSIIETEKMLIEMVKAELKRRNFKGKFNPLAHFFGYEGRSCYPSYFDAEYGYALGLGACALIVQKLTGYIVGFKNLTHKPLDWELKAVPLVSLMDIEKRKGVNKPVIKKQLVDLTGERFKKYSLFRSKDRQEDHYLFPGPMQYFGPKELCYKPPHLAAERS